MRTARTAGPGHSPSRRGCHRKRRRERKRRHGGAEEAPHGGQSVPAPPLNVDFLKQLLEQRGTYECKIGNLTLDCYLQAACARLAQPEDCYHETAIAIRLGQGLRLVGTKGGMSSMPVYPMPRLVRYAAFMGMDLLELDVPASWGQQALKYARKHDLEKALLEEAFASTSAIETFRASLGIEGAKGVVNMLLGGAGAAKIKATFGITRLPEKLLELQAELQGMRRHMMADCPAEWKAALTSKHPELTLASWHFQIGERVDLDKVSAKLPPAVIVHGWLGDSVLTTSGFDPAAFCAEMETQGLYITCRTFPRDAAEYFKSFLKKTGVEFDQRALGERQLRRKNAFEYAT